MGIEVEKKFLLERDFPKPDDGHQIRQGYLNRDKVRTVRVRTIDDEAFITIKGESVAGESPEFEYSIPPDDADRLLDALCERPLIEKTRYKVAHEGFTWEVDVFQGENEGLSFAEIELQQSDQEFSKPDWIGEEVTGDPRYFNSRLSEMPFREWNEAYSIILYFDPAARSLGESLAEQLRNAGFRVRADNWNDAKEPGDGPLSRFAPVNTIHFHPSAAKKAVQIRDDAADGFVLKEGSVVAPGSTWSLGPRQIFVLVPGKSDI